MTSKEDRSYIEDSLRERIKELNCLFGIADIIERSGNSIDAILQGAVNLLPASWQYPEITCARVIYKSKQFVTPLFNESAWSLRSDIIEGGEPIGHIGVFYLKKMPRQHEGPFLIEERQLLDGVCKSIGKALERISRIKKLEDELRSASAQTTALQDDLTQLKKAQAGLIEDLQANVEILIMPLIQRLTFTDDSNCRETGLLLERSMKNLLSPFLFTMSSRYPDLTTAELQIVKLIKEGLSTRQIAKVRGVSESTVHRQREHIRRKIGLTNKKINLTTYFRLVMNENP